MKTFLLLALLVGLIYYRFQDSTAPTQDVASSAAARSASTTVVAPTVIIASVPSSYDRWKTGPNAQTNLKTGPNAQTDFAPFAPSEQATWNQTSGYTSVTRRNVRVR